MKKLTFGFVVTLLFSITFLACRKGKDGAPGPVGVTGQSGSSTNILPYKNGSISAKITGKTALNGQAFTQNLNLEYFKGIVNNKHIVTTNGNGIKSDDYTITRFDSLGNSYITFTFQLNTFKDKNDSTIINVNSPYVTIATNTINEKTKEVFYFGTTSYNSTTPLDIQPVFLASASSGNPAKITIVNIVHNTTTGLLSFDYSLELDGYQNSTDARATMEGSINVSPYNIAYREATN